MVFEDDDLIMAIDQSWSTNQMIGIMGWILSKKDSVETAQIRIGDTCVPITSWHPRPDVAAAHSKSGKENCGFVVEIPRQIKHEVTFEVETQAKTVHKTVSFDAAKPPFPTGFTDASGLFNDFIQLVNDNQLRVLEIGSRIVSPGSNSKRPLFTKAASYTGFDYYPDSNTDVVGDAHRLSQYFDNQRFDAIFSIAVFEHLAMPWLVAMEISKLLEIGGITLHVTHNAWPLHEQPWDFWRFSDEGLKVLFSPPLGFEVIKAGFFEPLRMHLDTPKPNMELLPVSVAFGGVAILARKVAEINSDKFQWNVTVENVLGQQSHYPKPNQ